METNTIKLNPKIVYGLEHAYLLKDGSCFYPTNMCWDDWRIFARNMEEHFAKEEEAGVINQADWESVQARCAEETQVYFHEYHYGDLWIELTARGDREIAERNFHILKNFTESVQELSSAILNNRDDLVAIVASWMYYLNNTLYAYSDRIGDKPVVYTGVKIHETCNEYGYRHCAYFDLEQLNIYTPDVEDMDGFLEAIGILPRGSHLEDSEEPFEWNVVNGDGVTTHTIHLD